MTRDDFMSFFRDDDKLNTLSPDDRVEVFRSVLTGSSDLTQELLQSVVNDYGAGLNSYIYMDTISELERILLDHGFYPTETTNEYGKGSYFATILPNATVHIVDMSPDGEGFLQQGSYTKKGLEQELSKNHPA